MAEAKTIDTRDEINSVRELPDETLKKSAHRHTSDFMVEK
jgi:hypothetical protein